MKKLLILLTFVALLSGGTCLGYHICASGNKAPSSKRITGNGKLVTRTSPLPEFDILRTSRSVKVNLVAGGDRIVIEADDNLIDYVTVSSENRTLEISIDTRIKYQQPHITVTVPTDGRLRKLRASSSSDIVSEVALTNEEVALEATSSASIAAAVNAEACRIEATSSAEIHAGIRADRCTLSASSSADITAAVRTSQCTVRSSSSADITLSGEADHCTAECSSSSEYKAPRFAVKVYDLSVSSSADARIRCTERLTARVTTSGRIDYTGDCTVEKSVSTGGRISKK